MMSSIKKSQSKLRQVLDSVKADILSGKLRPGNRIKGVRALAAQFKVSARSAQTACELLEEEGLLECRHGDGTYVRQPQPERDNTIYFLVPNSAHLTLTHETSVMLRQIMAGAVHAAAPGQMVVPVPVTRNNIVSITKNPDAIDWAALERIPAGANLFVSSTWYAPIMPFLVERGVRGVYMASQYEQECPAVQKILRQTAWAVITIDRRAAMRRVIEFLHAGGRKRPAVIKRMPNQPDHPFRLGCLDGFKSCRMEYDDKSFREYAPGDDPDAVIRETVRRSTPDALILCAAELARPALAAAKEFKLKIPEDVAVMVYRDLPGFAEMQPALSVFDFPWHDIGGELARLGNDPDAAGAQVRFHALITERGSSVLGRGLRGQSNSDLGEKT